MNYRIETYGARQLPAWLAVPVLLGGAIVIWAGNGAGLWALAVPVGLVVALFSPRFRLGSAGLAGVLGWGLGLLWLAVQAPVGPTAAAVAGIIAGTKGTAVGVVLVLLIGLVLALAGGWIGVALRGAWRRVRNS